MYKINSNTDTKQFSLSNFLPYYDGVGYDPLNSEFRRRLVQLPISGRFIVSAKDEFRADLMAYNLYGSTSYWWIILDYNGLDSPEQLVVGTKISYPSSQDLAELFSLLKGAENQGTDSQPPESLERVTEELFPVSQSYLIIDEPRGDTIFFNATDNKIAKVFLDPSSLTSEVEFSLSGDGANHFDVAFTDSLDGKDYFRVFTKSDNLPNPGGDPSKDREAVLSFQYKELKASIKLIQFGEECKKTIYTEDDVYSFYFDEQGGDINIRVIAESNSLSTSRVHTGWADCAYLRKEGDVYVFKLTVHKNEMRSERSAYFTFFDEVGGECLILVTQSPRNPD